MIRRPEFLLTVALVFGVLLSPWIARAAGIDVFRVDPSPPQSLPDFEVAHLLDAPRFAQIDEYLADRMPLRGEAAQAATRSYATLSGDSPVNNVFIGDDGNLFLADDFTGACSIDYSAERLAETLQQWEAAGDGRDVFLTIAPDKSAIQMELLPGRAEAANDCQIAREIELVEAFSGTDQLIAVWQPLRAAERAGSPYRNYYRYDAHWTYRGALVFVEQVVDHLAPGQFETAEIVKGKNRRNPGAIARRLGWDEYEFRTKLGCNRPGTTTNESLEDVGIHGIRRYQSSGTDDLISGHTLVLHDSMMRYAEDPLACHFASVEMVHWDDFASAGFVDRVANADRIIIESVQRSIYIRTANQILDPAVDAAVTKNLGGN